METMVKWCAERDGNERAWMIPQIGGTREKDQVKRVNGQGEVGIRHEISLTQTGKVREWCMAYQGS